MISPVELRRIVSEWRTRVQRVKGILQPASWTEQEWRQFSQALALLIREHGQSWIVDPNVYWDLRWKLQDGGDLVCQVEHVPGEKTSLVVAQSGGFASQVGSYTWLWAEFNMEGDFSRDPYWVDGTWRDALTALLLPLDRQSSYLLAGRVNTPSALLLQEGARPNDRYFSLELTSPYGERKPASSPPAEEAPPSEPENSPPASADGSEVRAKSEPNEPEGDAPPANPPGEPSENHGSNGVIGTASFENYSANREGREAARPPSGARNRRRRQRAKIRYSRSFPQIQPRSYYRELKVVAPSH